MLSVGALGSGKTTLAQKLQYEAFLLGRPGDRLRSQGRHRFHLLEDVAPHVEASTLRPDPALRGMLDPLRVAPAHLRQEAAVSFLRDLLPGASRAGMGDRDLAAVDRVLRAPRAHLPEVVGAEARGRARRAGRPTLEIYARSGLTQLGFADPAVTPPAVGSAR